MRIYSRLRRLERWATAFVVPQTEEDPDDAVAAWCRDDCVGPLPSPGPRPTNYSPEQWQAQHRLLLALSCRAAGQADLLVMTPEEYRTAEETSAFFAALDPNGQLSLRQQARLAPYREVIARFLNDKGGGNMPAESPREELP